eukprot:1892593-Rhodomonas_salina.6
MMGPLPEAETFTSRPMVLLLGNHSSGKSSFVNHLMESKIQSCGVAPTDDCFTLITSGPDDTDQDGQALVGNKKLGFSALQSFGQMLISHTHLKVRKVPPAQARDMRCLALTQRSVLQGNET